MLAHDLAQLPPVDVYAAWTRDREYGDTRQARALLRGAEMVEQVPAPADWTEGRPYPWEALFLRLLSGWVVLRMRDGSFMAAGHHSWDPDWDLLVPGETAAEALRGLLRQVWPAPPPVVHYPQPVNPALFQSQERADVQPAGLGAEEFLVLWSWDAEHVSLSGQVLHSLQGARVPGKRVFLAGFRPERAGQFRGTLPNNGERWVCSLVQDTRPGESRGALIVKLRRQEAVGWAWDGSAKVYGAGRMQHVSLETGERVRDPGVYWTHPDTDAWNLGYVVAAERQRVWHHLTDGVESFWTFARTFGPPLRIEPAREGYLAFVYPADAHGCPLAVGLDVERVAGEARRETLILDLVRLGWVPEYQGFAFAAGSVGQEALATARCSLVGVECRLWAATASQINEPVWALIPPTDKATIHALFAADLPSPEQVAEEDFDVDVRHLDPERIEQWLQTHRPGEFYASVEYRCIRTTIYTEESEDGYRPAGSYEADVSVFEVQAWTGLRRSPKGDLRGGRKILSYTSSSPTRPETPTLQGLQAESLQKIVAYLHGRQPLAPVVGWIVGEEWTRRYEERRLDLQDAAKAQLDELRPIAMGAWLDEEEAYMSARREEAGAVEMVQMARAAAQASGLDLFVHRDLHWTAAHGAEATTRMETPEILAHAAELRTGAALIGQAAQAEAERRHQIVVQAQLDQAAREAEIARILTQPSEPAPWCVDSAEGEAALVAMRAQPGRGVAGRIAGTELLAPGARGLVSVTLGDNVRRGRQRELRSVRGLQSFGRTGTEEDWRYASQVVGMVVDELWHVGWLVSNRYGEVQRTYLACAEGVIYVDADGHPYCYTWQTVRDPYAPHSQDRALQRALLLRYREAYGMGPTPPPAPTPPAKKETPPPAAPPSPPATADQMAALAAKFGKKR